MMHYTFLSRFHSAAERRLIFHIDVQDPGALNTGGDGASLHEKTQRAIDSITQDAINGADIGVKVSQWIEADGAKMTKFDVDIDAIIQRAGTMPGVTPDDLVAMRQDIYQRNGRLADSPGSQEYDFSALINAYQQTHQGGNMEVWQKSYKNRQGGGMPQGPAQPGPGIPESGDGGPFIPGFAPEGPQVEKRPDAPQTGPKNDVPAQTGKPPYDRTGEPTEPSVNGAYPDRINGVQPPDRVPQNIEIPKEERLDRIYRDVRHALAEKPDLELNIRTLQGILKTEDADIIKGLIGDAQTSLKDSPRDPQRLFMLGLLLFYRNGSDGKDREEAKSLFEQSNRLLPDKAAEAFLQALMAKPK